MFRVTPARSSSLFIISLLASVSIRPLLAQFNLQSKLQEFLKDHVKYFSAAEEINSKTSENECK